ncbi:hypothetical protein KSD_12050 [Ktedonobacter sp. SOSP1-85]|nr:hypothetical protein KSD_12050 [Ktedonobacter sp. SOSP1-85]
MAVVMDEETPHIEVRAVQVDDAPDLYKLEHDFETDRVYTLHVRDHLLPQAAPEELSRLAFAFDLLETQVDPPIYKDFFARRTLEDVAQQLQEIEGGYVAIAEGHIAGAILLSIDPEHAVMRIQDVIVGRQYRRYGVGSLLLRCAADWARKRDCWAMVLETQNIDYPAIQFYLHNGLEIWGIQQHSYPPGSSEHEIAILMGKRLASNPT